MGSVTSLTTVNQALEAILTYVEGATGVKHTFGMDQDDSDMMAFRRSNHEDDLWILDVQYAPVDVSPESNLGCNPFALVMNTFSMRISMHINPVDSDTITQFDEACHSIFGQGYKATVDHVRGEPHCYTNLLTLENQKGRYYSVYVEVKFAWEHPNHGSNGKGILVWLRNGHIYRVDRSR